MTFVRIFACLACFSVICTVAVGQGVPHPSISLDSAEGVWPPNSIVPGTEITFHIRLTNVGFAQPATAIINGFSVYGSDPAVTWEWIAWGDGPVDFSSLFDLVWAMNTYSLTGSGADTLGWGGVSTQYGAGLVDGFDSVAFWMNFRLAGDQSLIGHHLCLDSTYYPPSGGWMWRYDPPHGEVRPSWDGPHCFEIVHCCRGGVGNIDFDPEDRVDIADVIYLVDWMFSDYGGDPDDYGPPPFCPEEADIDGSGEIDISDLVVLIEFMFLGGFPMPDCP
ncbi:MAG: hypothetical protein OEV49_11595 [candidate division Zixibacteria bacterium]|nr:hypothetical protein [candidate division Zixibacteria bacterium]MDH3938278.1 hypothetical protein [candidate division Zixibacteria bacterium]MDH4034415.1 hypothetical protein [candidate division Zixibacteria bacterium]